MRKLKKNTKEITSRFWENLQRIAAIICILLGIYVSIEGFYHAPEIVNNSKTNTTVASNSEYWTRHGTMGDWTAGVGGSLFSLAGFFLLYLSFKKQDESHKAQIANYADDHIESRLFELISLHRDNVSDLRFSSNHRKTDQNGKLAEPVSHIAYNRKVFKLIVNQFKYALRELDFIFQESNLNEIYEQEYLKEIQENESLTVREIDYKSYAQVDVIYLVVFFGVSLEGIETIKSITLGKYKREFISDILYFAALKPKVEESEWLDWYGDDKIEGRKSAFRQTQVARHKNSLEKPTLLPSESHSSSPKTFYKYYGGHQFRLGHYFRHLFQSITFIHRLKGVAKEKKYDYIKLIRGQLSTDEQIIFFF